MQRGKIFRRLAPFVALVAVLTQANVTFAAKTTTTSLTKAQIVDGMSVDQNLILSQKDGYGTEGANAYQAYGQMRLSMDPGTCNNSSAGGVGPVVTFSGEVDVQDVTTTLRIQSSAKADAGSNTADFWSGSTDVNLDLGTGPMSFEKRGVYQSDLGTNGVGGNPFIYIRFRNASMSYETDQTGGWTLIGRCVQGGDPVGVMKALNLPGRRFARLAASSCTVSGSDVSMQHKAGPKLRGQIAFANQRVDNPTSATHSQVGSEFQNATVGFTFRITEPELLFSAASNKWAGGNPAFGVRFQKYDAQGNVDGWTSTMMLGRCKDLIGAMPGTVDFSYLQ